MNQAEKDKLMRYGKIICDFANAETPDDFLISFYDNVQAVFNFSDDIKERALELFPTLFTHTPQQKINNCIKNTQGLIKSLLLKIIESERAYKSEDFSFILNEYNEIPKTASIINDDYVFTTVSPFDENYSYAIKKHNDKVIIIIPVLCYCLIEYFKDSEYHGREKLSVCSKCNCIFSKSRLNLQQHYCPICSRKNKMNTKERAKYQKEYRANPARKKAEAKKKREIKIQHLMINAGKTRKKAETIVDSEM